MTAIRTMRFAVSLDVVIRPCRPDDLPKLEWFGAFRHHREIFERTFARQREGEALMLVADRGDFPVAQAWLDFRPGRLFVHPKLWAVRVMEPLQGLGIGGRLISAAEQAAHGIGHPCLELGVERSNPRARVFYEALGWRVVREHRDNYSYTTPDGRTVTCPLDEFVLERRLDESLRAMPMRA
jgi:ribosomal protein S18 acetylase RimI-like enzyme